MTDRETVRFGVEGLVRPQRLDKVLRERYPRWGRSAVGSLIHRRQVRVNGRVVHLSSWLVENGDQIEVRSPPEDLPLPPDQYDDRWTLAHEPDLIAVNKPAGLLSQGVRPGDRHNLLSLAQARFGELHLFHRLDRDTSGVALLTRPGPVNRFLDAVFKAGTVVKVYLAVVPALEELPAEGVIEARIGPHPRRRDRMMVVNRGGQRAVTHYRMLGTAEGVSLLELRPETGRTHQLRVHLAHLGRPILGDRLYGARGGDKGGLMLHAWRITLPAVEDAERIERRYTAPLPAEWHVPPGLEGFMEGLAIT